ncbi:PspC domain-containing protein [Nocardia sp. alder85J]|uniref:PspC domain-containing protein n=1 Tax=Nocardia sp. alder85J TaxID=2862949 RepID=UPI001CD6AD4B|nr:PspC domain-containing protein [Nocardia sp. alder85J]MCX4097199.1 PspC domain-containing protein [Nocardia sp. alder85J]
MTRASGWAGGTGSRAGFNEQLQHLWRTRPVRRPRQGPVAGVAVGFGRRYDVDPVLIRIAFVVATIFGGAGIVLYLAAWLLLPAAGDQVSPAQGLLGKGYTGQSPMRTVVLLIALVIALATMGPVGVGLGGSGLISFALMVAGWWLLYLRQPQPPADEVDPLTMNPIAATGYPGTVFPGGSPWAAHPYGPYTTLPDHYEPDPAAATVPDPRDAGVSASGTTASAPGTTTATATGAAAASGGGSPADAAVTTDEFVPGATDPVVDAPESDDPAGPAPSTTSTASRFRGRGDARRDTTADSTRFGARPPGWDPLGVSPLAWDLPDPAPPRPVAVLPRPPRSRLTPIVIGHAVLAAAIAGGIAALGVDWMTPARIGAVALAVVGLGLIVGAFLRRGYGLMVLLAPLAGFVILAAAIGPVEFDRGAVGEHAWAPATAAELDQPFRVSAGTGTLDLRSLALTDDRTATAKVRMGNLRVLVPESMRLDTTCTVRLADAADCPQGLTGPAIGPVLHLDIDVRAGHVEVKRG